MANEIVLPDELLQAAAALEKRLQILQVPSFKIPSSKWETLPDDIRNLIPAWIPTLLSNYSLVGAGLQFEHHNRHAGYPILFSFSDPANFEMLLKNSLYRSLIKFGFFPFAFESDGSVWLTTALDGSSGKIYLLELSSWAGIDAPTKEHGLIYAHKNLAHLLSAMAVNNESFEKLEDCMWGKRQ